MPTKPAKIGQNCYASGWGMIGHPIFGRVKELMVAPLEILGYNGCYYALNEKILFFSRERFQELFKEFIRWDVCTSNKPKSICSGDSGGPFTCDENGIAVVHGIASVVLPTGL